MRRKRPARAGWRWRSLGFRGKAVRGVPWSLPDSSSLAPKVGEQERQIERLCQKGVEPGFTGSEAVFRCGVGRVSDEQHPGSQGRSQLPSYLVAVQARQADVHQGNIRMARQGLLDSLFAVGGYVDMVPE